MRKEFVKICCFLLCIQCKEESVSTYPAIQLRDTTIKPQNAVTKLNLDSITIAHFIRSEVSSEIIANKIQSFYNIRNYQFAWFNEEGLTEQAEGFWDLHKNYSEISESTLYNKQLHRQMDELLNADTVLNMNVDTLALTELRLTQHFFQFVHVALGRKLDPEQLQWHIPRRKLDAVTLLDSLFKKKELMHTWKPQNSAFHLFQDALIQYHAIQESGGWSILESPKRKWSIGDQNDFIAKVKQRLKTTGNFQFLDTSIFFTGSLERAVRQMKKSFGLKVDGIIDAALIEKLNIPVEDRIKQMFINLERMRWMPERPLNYIVANIPEYKLHVYENGHKILSMNIVVGKTANRTVIFSDTLKYVVFSPYWNIPTSIIKREILPAMEHNHNYLKRRNMEITGYRSEVPIIRQKPGIGNALGQVKFIFPNRYNIYFHDTPSKSLFNRQRRAFSHGCIRLEKPFALARYILRNDTAWTDEKIQSAMVNGKERWVSVAQPIPVFITYFTSWVDSDGVVYFRNDIYGHDKKMAKHLFE